MHLLLLLCVQDSGALLAVTVAWDSRLPSGTCAAAAVGEGAATLQDALHRATTALQRMHPAASLEAGCRSWAVEGQADTPTEAQWQQTVDSLLADLGALPSSVLPSTAQLSGLDVDSARQEYMMNGQQVRVQGA